MADTTLYIDYNSGTPVIHDANGNVMGKNSATQLKTNEQVTLEMRGFPANSDPTIVDIKFYNSSAETLGDLIGTFTPATTATTTISSNNTDDFYCEVKNNDFTRAYITDKETVAANTEDDFWYTVDVKWKDGNGNWVPIVPLDPELINKPGSKGPGGG